MAGESVPGGRSSAITRVLSWRGTPEPASIAALPTGFFGAKATTLDLLVFRATGELLFIPLLTVAYRVRSADEIRRVFAFPSTQPRVSGRVAENAANLAGRGPAHEHPGAIYQR